MAHASSNLPSGTSRERVARPAGASRPFETTHLRRELHPNSIRSDTPCHEAAVWQVESLPACDRRRCPPKRARTTISIDLASRSPSAARERECRARVASLRPAFARRRLAPRAKGRFTRAPAKGSELDCTRGAFHRRAKMARSAGFRLRPASHLGRCPQVVANLWRTHGAVARFGTLTLWPGALTGNRRRELVSCDARWTMSAVRRRGVGFDLHSRAATARDTSVDPGAR